MTSRDAILGAARRNRPAAVPLPEVPPFDAALAEPLPRFKDSLERMGGRLAEPAPGTDLTRWMRERYPDARVICSAVREITGTRPLDPTDKPAVLDDVDLGIVRAAFAVAETGSICLGDRDLVVTALGYLAQHLLVLLDPADILGNLHHAFARPEFAQARYCVLMSGPSATADIEGVLIHGAQGVRSLTVALVPRPAGG